MHSIFRLGQIFGNDHLVFEDGVQDAQAMHPSVPILPTVASDEQVYSLFATSDVTRAEQNPEKYFAYEFKTGITSYFNLYNIATLRNNIKLELERMEHGKYIELLRAFYNYQEKDPHPLFGEMKKRIEQKLLAYDIKNEIAEQIGGIKASSNDRVQLYKNFVYFCSLRETKAFDEPEVNTVIRNLLLRKLSSRAVHKVTGGKMQKAVRGATIDIDKMVEELPFLKERGLRESNAQEVKAYLFDLRSGCGVDTFLGRCSKWVELYEFRSCMDGAYRERVHAIDNLNKFITGERENERRKREAKAMQDAIAGRKPKKVSRGKKGHNIVR